MSRIIILFLLSCVLISCDKNDEGGEVVNLRLDHHYEIGITVTALPTLRFQEGNDLAGDQWKPFYNYVEGLEYEPGFVYDLRVRKRDIPNPPADASSIRYTLEKLVSKTPVPPVTTFEMDLKSFGSTHVIEENNAFTILYSIPLDCGSLCDDMNNAVENQQEVIDVFTHDGTGGVVLREIK